MLVVELARYSAALVIPLFLLGAHFHQGADIPFTNALYSFSLCVIFALTILFTGFRSLPLGVGLVASIFLIWLSLGLFGNWYQARHEVLALAAAGAVAATGYLIGTHSGGLRLAWSALIWSLILFTLMAAYLHFTGTTEGGRFSRRLSGGFGSPNTAATLFGLAVLLAASKLTMRFQDSRLSRLSRADRINYLAQKEYASLTLFILASLCLILTISRAGIAIGFMCLLGLMIFELARISRRGRLRFLRRPAFQLPVGSLVIVLMFLVVTGEINPHRSESLLENADGRTDLFSIYWTIWLEDPWFGHGLGSFNTLNDARATLDTAPAMVSIGAVHN
ncbi:MAG: O-antigen ligase family protein, partial [Pseudomonadota bacterium]